MRAARLSFCLLLILAALGTLHRAAPTVQAQVSTSQKLDAALVTKISQSLPGTPFVLRIAYAEARRFIAAGVPVAVGSDLNPNCYGESLPFAFTLSVYEMKMTPAEALVAITINAAVAIRREHEIGSLKAGKLADIVILKGPSYLHLGYHIGGNPIKTVIKRGRVVVGK